MVEDAGLSAGSSRCVSSYVIRWRQRFGAYDVCHEAESIQENIKRRLRVYGSWCCSILPRIQYYPESRGTQTVILQEQYLANVLKESGCRTASQKRRRRPSQLGVMNDFSQHAASPDILTSADKCFVSCHGFPTSP